MNDAELSDREQEILKLVATGVSNKEISQKLFISPNTVKVHLRNVFAKIGVASRTEATLFAIQHGWVSPEILDRLSPDEKIELAGDGSPAAAPATPAVEPLIVAGPLQVNPRKRWVLIPITSLAVVSLLFLVALGLRAYLVSQAATTAAFQTNNSSLPARWGSGAALPEPRQGLALVTYEDNIIAIGGESIHGVTGRVDQYIPSLNTWKEMAAKPHPVSNIQAVLLGEKIYVPGGRGPDEKPTNFVEVFDPRRNLWENKTPLPIAISDYAMAALEGKLYLFGGWDGDHVLASVYSYDPSQDKWQLRAPMSAPRSWAGATAINGKIYVIGGYDGKNALSTNEAYYPQRDGNGENPWEKHVALPQGRYGMAVAGLVDTIYLVGGKNQAKGLDQEYSPLADRWVAFESSPVQVGAGAAMVPFQNQLYLMGGETTVGPANTNLVYQAIYTVVIPLIQK